MKLTLDLTTVCSRLVSIDNKKLVTFYDSDRKTVLYQITLEYGSPITYLGPDVSKKQDAHYNYEFYRWENADYTPAQMVATSDLSLYARYWQHERFYTVTWILDGVSYDEQYNYGATPVSPFPSEKAENEGYTYRFSGWSSASYEEGGLHPVTGNVTYTARFEPIPKQFTVTWIFEGIDGKNVVVEEQYEYLAYPRYTGNTEYADSNYRYTFKGWQETVQSVKGNASYHARIEKTPLAVTDAGETLNVTHTSDALTVDCTADRVDIREAAQSANTAGKRLVLAWEEFTLTLTPDAVAMLINSPCRKLGITQKEVTPIGTVYTVGFFNSLNYSISPTFSVLLESRSEANSPMAAYLLRDGEWQSIGDTAAELQGSASFRIARLASITVLPVSNCDLSQLVRMAEVGKTVDLKLGCKFGFEVSSAVVRLADGTPIEVKDLTFVMPNGDVTVELTVSQIVYHVSFVVDGVVILEKDYLLGEQIVAPADPTKASDGVFDYTFGGWSKSVTVAYGADRNPIFEAVFVATEIPKVDPYKSLHNNNLFLTVILPIFLSVVAAGVIALIVLKTLKKRKLRRAQESESTAPDTDNDSATNSATDDGQANATPSSANEKNAPEKEAE